MLHPAKRPFFLISDLNSNYVDNFEESKRQDEFLRSFKTWKYSISLLWHTEPSHLCLVQSSISHSLVCYPHFSAHLSVLIHCSVNQLWSEYFYSSPLFHGLNQKRSLNLYFHTPGSRAVRRLSWFPSLIRSPVQCMNSISLPFQTLSLPVCLALTHTELWALLGAVLN